MKLYTALVQAVSIFLFSLTAQAQVFLPPGTPVQIAERLFTAPCLSQTVLSLSVLLLTWTVWLAIWPLKYSIRPVEMSPKRVRVEHNRGLESHAIQRLSLVAIRLYVVS